MQCKIQESEYSKAVSALLKTRSPDRLLCGTPQHISCILEKMITHATKSVFIHSRYLSGCIFGRSLYNALSAKKNILIDIYVEVCENDAEATNIIEAIKTGELPNISIHFQSKKQCTYRYAVMDDDVFLFLPDKDCFTGFMSANDPKTAKYLLGRFKADPQLL